MAAKKQPKRKRFDVMEFLVGGGTIDFHSGSFRRKVTGIDTVVEEGTYSAYNEEKRLEVPYRAVITLRAPRPERKPEPKGPSVRGAQ